MPVESDPHPPLPRVHVRDHLARCLLCTLIFPFTGWLAVRHSLRVNHRLLALDREGAETERRLALRWYRISLASFFLGTLLFSAWRIRRVLEEFNSL